MVWFGVFMGWMFCVSCVSCVSMCAVRACCVDFIWNVGACLSKSDTRGCLQRKLWTPATSMPKTMQVGGASEAGVVYNLFDLVGNWKNNWSAIKPFVDIKVTLFNVFHLPPLQHLWSRIGATAVYPRAKVYDACASISIMAAASLGFDRLHLGVCSLRSILVGFFLSCEMTICNTRGLWAVGCCCGLSHSNICRQHTRPSGRK